MLSSKIHNWFISYYRYPFKLVVRPRKLLSKAKATQNRYSPAGFNKNKKIKYDLYIEPDSLKKISNAIGCMIACTILFTSICFIITSNDLDTSQQIAYFIIPIMSFSLPYFIISLLINANYYSYPLFYHVWSEKIDCYQEWFTKVPQKIKIHRNDNEEYLISSFMGKKSTTQHRYRQALYYAWNSGSPQKGMWLLSIENLISEWELKGIFKKQTSIFVILYPIFLSYFSLVFVLIILDTFFQELVKNMYIPLLLWLFLSLFYLLIVYMFVSERKKNEIQANRNINSFIPYEFRSSTSRYNNLYKNFQDAHFITVNNLLFAGLSVFYISLIALIK